MNTRRWQVCQPYGPDTFYILVKVPGTHDSLRLTRYQGCSATERIRSVEDLKDVIENLTIDLSACDAVPHSTATAYPSPTPNIATNLLRWKVYYITQVSFFNQYM
jgi:hypothetical protein